MNARKYMVAYGMNTNRDQMSRRCPAAKYIGTVELTGHKLAFKGCCDVVVDSQTSMICALWDITEDCESSLDILEGYPDFYGKKEVAVTFNDKKIKAMIYFMQYCPQLAIPSESYLHMVLEGYQDCDMPTEQIKRALEEVEHEYYTW